MTATLEELIKIAPLGDNRFEIEFGPRTMLWSVNGGYIAAAALRIAEKIGKFARPGSISCQFLRTIRPGPVETSAAVITSHTSAELIQVDLHQGGKHCAFALVWTIASKNGPTHRAMQMPVVPHPDELRRLEDIMEPGEPPIHAFWEAFEQRPINRIASLERSPRTPHFFRWFRSLCPQDALSQFARASAFLPIVDVMGVASATQMYEEPFLQTLVPTVQLTVQFYDLSDVSDWFLSDSLCEYAGGGLIPAQVKIWSVRGDLLAYGLSQMVTRDSGTGAYVAGKTD
jgi:acyl-CoA thioesterase